MVRTTLRLGRAPFIPKALICMALGLGAASTVALPAPAVMAQPATKVAGDILSFLNEISSLGSVLDGTGGAPPETIDKLKSQIAALRDEIYPSANYALKDYALSVGAIVGEGEGIVTEIEGALALASAREGELKQLDARDAQLAEIETAYAVADRAVRDAADVLLKTMEGIGGADAMAGHPIFNNWYVLDQEIAPLFGERLSQIQRIRRELGARRKQLHDHLQEARTALGGMKSHLDRIIERREAQNIGSAPDDLLERMRNRGSAIAAKAEEIKAANAATREEVRRIQEAQAKAMKEADLLKQTLAIAQLGLAIYGSASTSGAGPEGGAGASPDSGAAEGATIDIRIENTIINVVPPPAPPLAPQPPVDLGPVR